MQAERPAPYEVTAPEAGEVCRYLSSLDPELLTESLANHYADQADKTNEVRRATLAQTLPYLNARLKDELQGLLHFQNSLEAEDQANSHERALGRSFNAERRRQERQAILHNIEQLRLQPMPEGLNQAEQKEHKRAQELTLCRLETALEHLRTNKRLTQEESPPKRPVPPKRNHRREEAARRTALIRELTQFCEVVESVVAGEKIVNEETLEALIRQAHAYLESENLDSNETPDYTTTLEHDHNKATLPDYTDNLKTRAQQAAEMEAALEAREKWVKEQEAKYGEDWYLSEDRRLDEIKAQEEAEKANEKAKGQSP